MVTLRARDVTVREILSEWARVGRTRVVNGERIPGGPLSLELTGVPERQALDVILRSVSGYMAAKRVVPASDASIFDRIMVLPTSTPVAASTAGPFGGAARPAAPPPNIFTPTQPDTSDVGIEPDDPQSQQNVMPAVAPNGQPARFFPAAPGRGFRPPEAGQGPIFTPGTVNGVEPDTGQPAPPQAPTSPFGIPSGTSAVPGVVIQPPQQQQPGQPQGNRP
jgi:hypothetical protein